MLEKFCENFLIKLRDSQTEYSNRLLSGSFKTFDEYRFIAGIHKGLVECESMVKGVYKDMVEMTPLEEIRNRIYGSDRDKEGQ